MARASIRITYNAPVVLSFSLIAAIVLTLDEFLQTGLRNGLFSIGGSMDPGSIRDWGRLFFHTLGHGDWTHLLGNLSFLLLLGPILEERYGSGQLLLMIMITSIATGLLNVLLFDTGLLGASGIVFMMILLSSFVNVKRGEIPLTFILIVLLYVVKELVDAFGNDNVSQFAHLAGGALGSIFGFMRLGKGS